MAVFFRLIDMPDTEDLLLSQISSIREGEKPEFEINPEVFKRIPGGILSYWMTEFIIRLFEENEKIESNNRNVRQGLATADDFRFLRLFWEVKNEDIVEGDTESTQSDYKEQTNQNKKWVPFSKGGEYSPYYSDLHLLVNWESEGKEIRSFEKSFIRNVGFYFNPGLTWTLRTQRGFSMRIHPSGAIFGHKGPVLFTDITSLPKILGLANSSLFSDILSLQMAFGSYEVGVLQRTPIPNLDNPISQQLAERAMICVSLKRDLDRSNETSHVFHLPALLQVEGNSIIDRIERWLDTKKRVTLHNLDYHQGHIDDLSIQMYGINQYNHEISGLKSLDLSGNTQNEEEDIEEEYYDTDSASNRAIVADLVSYLIGVAFGRWDLRHALGALPTPLLPDPFEPLPAYSPGMLRLEDEIKAIFTFNKDGIIPDDEDHQNDLIFNLRNLLDTIFKNRTNLIEKEICTHLNITYLRGYFRRTRKGGFWPDHIQKYSRSRRKAPIYWLLQSPKSRYALWLYYPRLNSDTLATALREYVEPKLRREQDRLAVLRADTQGLEGRAKREVERQVERQEELLNDIQDFRERLERVVRRGLRPDHNDGVLLTIAPLWELVPWPEAKRTWDELQAGKYEWSSISRQLRGLPVEAPETPPDPGEQAQPAEPRDERSVLGRLRLRHIGPAEELDLQLDPRINIMTGDNGLGKTFVLDAAWQALTGVEPPIKLRPPLNEDTPLRPEITYEIVSTEGLLRDSGTLFYERSSETWKPSTDSHAPASGIQPRAGVVLYVRAEGSIAIWDRIKRVSLEQRGLPPAVVFNQYSLWRGIVEVSAGLIADVNRWLEAVKKRELPGAQLNQEEQIRAELFDLLNRLLERLSPDYLSGDPEDGRLNSERFVINGSRRVSISDDTDYPTITMPYDTVPILHASAGVQRILSIAYALVWAYKEHRNAAISTGQTPDTQIIVLLDEVELHLHPKWQRRIVPALLDAIEHMLGDRLHVQFLLTTHAPLVLASLEPHFDEEQDQLFDFDLKDGKVVLYPLNWVKYGSATRWLESTVFDLAEARSIDAEKALRAAEAYMQEEDPREIDPKFNSLQKIQEELERTIPEKDAFWDRWHPYRPKTK